MNSRKLLILAGDGIGPEVMREARLVADWFERERGIAFDISEDLVGGAALDTHGTPLRDETLQAAREADAILFGSVGGPKWADQPFDNRPEVALLRLRSELDLFANLRPSIAFDPLINASPIKPEIIRGLDVMIVRESAGGVYFGHPRGIETLADGSQRGINTEVYTTAEIERVARVAFELARKRNNHVTSVEKCNVMESGLLWKQVVTALQLREYPDVKLSHMLADNCAMQLVKSPAQFDVIVTGNLFGDLLSDLASVLPGSLGMLPSATLGARHENGRLPGMYEPIHGSAPDIAGSGKANPLAQILSLAMLLRYSFDLESEAILIETAVAKVLDRGLRTPDIMSRGMTLAGTREMGAAVLEELDKVAKAHEIA